MVFSITGGQHGNEQEAEQWPFQDGTVCRPTQALMLDYLNIGFFEDLFGIAIPGFGIWMKGVEYVETLFTYWLSLSISSDEISKLAWTA